MIVIISRQDVSSGNSPSGIHTMRWAPLTLFKSGLWGSDSMSLLILGYNPVSLSLSLRLLALRSQLPHCEQPYAEAQVVRN